jgi:subtilase family serine protease
VVVDQRNDVAEGNEDDNQYTKTFVVNSSGQTPNLTPYKPSGWSDRIVVSKSRGATRDDDSFSSDTPLYVDLSVVNLGKKSITDRFRIGLYVDDEQVESFHIDVLGANRYIYALDKAIGKLEAGRHTIKVVADSTELISESNEEDNQYGKVIMVD